MVGTDPRAVPPGDDVVELSVIGPGYGECVILHVGRGSWIVVDSCIDVQTRRPVALDYLELLGLDIKEHVRLVVATHWHDDHIRGLEDVLRSASKARFVLSTALRAEEFTTLTSLVEPRMMLVSSGVAELSSIYHRLAEVGQPPMFAIADRRLWQPAGKPSRSVWALSPSDRALQLSVEAISSLLQDPDLPNRRVPDIRPNHTSVVLWADAGGPVLLLGADLEEVADPEAGWSAIVASGGRPQGLAAIFKIPHHGSANAHSDDVWDRIVERDAIAVLTPYRRGRNLLPTGADVRRLVDRAAAVYVTQGGARPTSQWPPPVDAVLQEATEWVEDGQLPPGHVRLRRSFTNLSAWSVELFGGAMRL